MIKLIASDMDGTLLNDKIEVSAKNAAAIRQAQAAGIEFIVATGRNLPQAQVELLAHDLHPAYITINGALVYDEAETITVQVPLTNAKLQALFDVLDASGLYYELEAADGVISNAKAGRIANLMAMYRGQDATMSVATARQKAEARTQQIKTTYVADYREVFTDPALEAYKVIVFSDDEQAGLAPVKARVEALGGLVVTSSGARNIEINDLKAQKGPALAAYAQKRGYTMDEVMAIGDNLNDESMIRQAKYSVAMGNAIPLIKELAWHTTLTNREDGVAKAIQRALALNQADSQGERNDLLH